ncbi:hypothetical protein JMJ56_24810 [Belnapia sp. T18]|uniref:Methyltransferase n=1 Tax=Belnapia arida TaxID=2804533 RepID=A0ABS1UD93_9PROT|nr:hypothetical protein [Belnapia arida]MBL6081221.1 hypothetical protein [Belnapia arida]
MAEALRALYPTMAPPAPPEGFIALSDPNRVHTELEAAGLSAIEIEEMDAVWEGPAGPAYLDDVRELHGYMGAYAMLGDEERRRVNDVILQVVDRIATGDRIVLRSPVILAVGTRR